MNAITAVSVFVLFGAVIGMVATPSASADHAIAEVTNAEGSSVPGCEETNECFIPHTVTVDVGGEVIWSNSDLAAHTITSGVLTEGGPDGVFDSGLLSPGVDFSHKFEEAGEYPYFCLVHPWMAGLVIVQETMEGHDDEDPAMKGDDKMMMGGDDKMMMITAEDATAMDMLSDGTNVMIKASEAMAGESMKISVLFENSEHVNYDIMAVQNDAEVLMMEGAHEHQGMGTHMTDPLPTDDPVDITITFQGYGVTEITGPAGEMLTFAQIVPEFGTIAALVLAVAIVSIVVVSAKSRLSIIPRY